MFNKVLIANRGAIAVRIIRTLKKLGVKSIAIYSEEDADSLHVRLADQAYSLGSGSATETYLDQRKIFQVINDSGAEAVHPGYGFLSENATFVEQCEKRDVVFIGPTPGQMRDFGLKHTARSIARANEVPLLLGSNLLETPEVALRQAAEIGYPVILKSTAGGGGIGMQICTDEVQLGQAFVSVKRLSANNFSNDGVFVEKYIEFARHIEVQVFGDGQGHAIALGERDCSTQRRNQKVIEETPAPNIPEGVRRSLHDTAVRLMSSVNYRGAGTVEFIYDQNKSQFYFLEVNTRLQVEHGVTEQIFGVDLVEWMLKLAAGELHNLAELGKALACRGHAIQARIYAENPANNFLPSAGLLSEVAFPEHDGNHLRIDHWVEQGLEVSPYFDPMLAKVIAWAEDRNSAINKLDAALKTIVIHGVETNSDYVSAILATPVFRQGEMFTRYLTDFEYRADTIDVISPGTMTTVQDYPGRTGYWDVGVPPSGPFDSYAFRLANTLVGNTEGAAGLEVTLSGPTFKFNCATIIAITGAEMDVNVDGVPVEFNQPIDIAAGQILKLGKVKSFGARAYLAVAGGFQANTYLGSKSTFTLGQFGGFSGRALKTGDVLHIEKYSGVPLKIFDKKIIPGYSCEWTIRVIYGPHGAPDFFTANDIEAFFTANWEVHYNSSRTGIRLIGPKPQWARASGGEAGMHPSNIHDNAYAVGTVDFTGDMPVILGPDGPSLGGFVCPATVISADLWKLGQLKAGDKVKFVAVDQQAANDLESEQEKILTDLTTPTKNVIPAYINTQTASPIYHRLAPQNSRPAVVYRPAGDKFLLIEYGPLELDIALRFRAHAMMLWLREQAIPGVRELTPGIRSLQVHYDSRQLPLTELIEMLEHGEEQLQNLENFSVPSRIIHLPLSWDDQACQLAIKKYMQSVRGDAPWCPSNIEFIRRINGLDSIEEVKKIVFDANYLVMGLGDVYLGAPVATPLDPRHRLVTTKYNPARTWTAENSVGIGGSYLCIYGMEGPGGYQFVGRTLQMWNRYRKTREFEQPWLLRFFDQIKFYQVGAEELGEIRREFPRGNYPLKIEQTEFNIREYNSFIEKNNSAVRTFTEKRERAFDEELQRWVASGQINFDTLTEGGVEEATLSVPENCTVVESQIAGNLWQWQVKKGQQVDAGQTICILESMKMEIEVTAPERGTVEELLRAEGQPVAAGQVLTILRVN